MNRSKPVPTHPVTPTARPTRSTSIDRTRSHTSPGLPRRSNPRSTSPATTRAGIGWVVMTMLAIAVADRTYAPEILFNGPLLISIAQKTFGLLFLLALLERYRTQRLPAIDWLGKHSAMIFLLHPLIIGALLLSPYISGIFIPELFVSMAIVALTARKFGYTVGRYMTEPKQAC